MVISFVFIVPIVLMSQSNCDAINKTIKRPPTARICDGTRQRQARIDLADGTEDDEVASQLAEAVARCADFNVTQKHLIAAAYPRRNDAVLCA